MCPWKNHYIKCILYCEWVLELIFLFLLDYEVIKDTVCENVPSDKESINLSFGKYHESDIKLECTPDSTCMGFYKEKDYVFIKCKSGYEKKKLSKSNDTSVQHTLYIKGMEYSSYKKVWYY